MPSMLSREEVARYHDDGYIFVRGLFDADETDLLRRAMEEDPAIRDHSLLRADQEGGATRISLWNRAGDSVYGLAVRTPRVVDTAEALIGESVYHFQSKLTAKDPRVGGANGAQGMKCIILASPKPERDAAFVGAMFRGDLSTIPDGVSVSCGPSQEVHVVTPRAIVTIDPSFDTQSNSPILAGVSIVSADERAATHASSACGMFVQWIRA